MATAGRFQPPMGGIVDPTYLEQLAILNQMQATQPVQAAQPFDFLGSGLVDGSSSSFAPQVAVPDWRSFRPVAPAVTQTAPVDGGGGGSIGSSGGGFGSIGQGVNTDLANLGLNLMVFPAFSAPGAVGRGIADAQINAMANAYNNLALDQGLLGAISSGGGGIQTVSDQHGNTFTFSSPATVQAYDQSVFGPASAISSGGGFEGGFGFGGVSASDTGNLGFGGGSLGGFASDGASGPAAVGPSGGISEGFDGSPSAPSAGMGGQEGFDGSPADGGGGGGGGKIVCTAMNQAYGFGSFRQAIWLRYSADHMTKAHEAGYHAMFLPLVDAAYRQQAWYSKPLRKALENIARHRTADLRAEMRGTKRDTLGRAYRLILEPLCYAVGKLKGY